MNINTWLENTTATAAQEGLYEVGKSSEPPRKQLQVASFKPQATSEKRQVAASFLFEPPVRSTHSRRQER